jgi:hypothetical protein
MPLVCGEIPDSAGFSTWLCSCAVWRVPPAFFSVNEHVIRVSEILFPFLPNFAETFPVLKLGKNKKSLGVVHTQKELSDDLWLPLQESYRVSASLTLTMLQGLHLSMDTKRFCLTFPALV